MLNYVFLSVFCMLESHAKKIFLALKKWYKIPNKVISCMISISIGQKPSECFPSIFFCCL